MEITFKSIGTTRNQEKKKHFGSWKDVVTELIIDKPYMDALYGLKDFSHCIVIYFMHEVKKCDIRHVPQGKVGIVPEVGIFACRCTQRPNPIGITTVEIIDIKDNIVSVKGLDVISGTPLLDIKPYTPQYDFIPNAKTPDWINKLDY